VVADLGVSSPQLDQAERGFSFRQPGPIDMRMDPEQPLTAAEIVNTWDEQALADLVHRYGEDRQARRIARTLLAGRPWTDSAQLGSAIAKAIGGAGRIHPATRTFQALRIAVNDELGEVERLLPQIVDRLHPGGRMAIITFHSLEDRLVKRFLDQMAGKGRPRDPFGNPIGPVHLRVLPDRAPADDDPNPRARSARLRRAVRLPWSA
jgi:16S rRNA (cytosine1402-N4)-methyltransferase